MRTVWLAWLVVVACRDDRHEHVPPVPAPVPPPPDARAAPPADAPLALAPHRFIRVKDFSETAYPGWQAIELVGLPAYDAAAKRIAVGRVEQQGLVATQPNVEVWFLNMQTQTVEPLRVWSQEESFALRGNDRSPEKLRELVLAMDARVTEVEPALASFTPIPATCVASDPLPDPKWWAPCDGHEIWTCGDMVFRQPRTTRSGRREVLVLERGGKTVKKSIVKWFKPPYRVPSTKGGYESQEMIACIHNAWIVPGSDNVLFEVAHACNASGDMCSGGVPTYEIVEP